MNKLAVVSLVNVLLLCPDGLCQDDPVTDTLKAFSRRLDEGGYWLDLFSSLELFAETMMAKEDVLDAPRLAHKERKQLLRALKELKKKGSASIFFSETHRFQETLKKDGYGPVFLTLVCLDVQESRTKPEFHSGLIFKGDLLRRLNPGEAEERNAGIPFFLTVRPKEPGVQRPFNAHCTLTFFALQGGKGCLRTLDIHLYLEELSRQRGETVCYPWKVKNKTYK
jgi:hypothetical protein